MLPVFYMKQFVEESELIKRHVSELVRFLLLTKVMLLKNKVVKYGRKEIYGLEKTPKIIGN